MESNFSVYRILGVLLLLLSSTPQTCAQLASYKKEISAINLLLPVSQCPSQQECRHMKHELSASNGCYSWDISHPQMVSMQNHHIRGDCVDSVTLEPLLHEESKTLIWITAKDKNSGQILRSQVKLGLIHHLSILSSYRHFYVNDRSHVEVAAFDDEGNIFSGLEGLRFQWTITSGETNIKMIARPEGYSHHGRNGTDIFYLKGLQEGTAVIQVDMLEPGYEHIAPVDIKVSIVEPFVIEPEQTVFVLPTSQFAFSLSYLKMNDLGAISKKPIAIPNKKYEWSVRSVFLGDIEQDGTFTSHLTEGQQRILVEDRDMTNNTAEARINIVFPYRLDVKIRDISDKETQLKAITASSFAKTLLGDSYSAPSETHILIEDRLYLITLSLFDKDENQITLTDNLQFVTENLSEHAALKFERQNKIGSELVFRTKKIAEQSIKIPTVHKLKAIHTLQENKYTELNTVRLTTDVELTITKPVQIVHPTDYILLPYFVPAEIWNTSARGGSGVYEWSVLDTAIATVEGSAVVSGLKIGKTKLVVCDHRNHQNKAAIEIEVATIHQLKWLEDQMELSAQQGGSQIVNVIALDRQGRKFTNCTAIYPSFSTKGEGNIKIVQHSADFKYDAVRSYVFASLDLLSLKQRFEEQPQQVLGTDLGERKMSQELMTYNNFGICTQATVVAAVEGIGRVKSSLKLANGSLLESEFAEIAVYQPLKTVGPVPEFSDLLSVNQLGQEFTSFDTMFTSPAFNVLLGSEVTWQVQGGTNFWSDYADKYSIETSLNPADSKAVQVEKASIQTTKFDLRIKCLAQDITKGSLVTVQMNQTSKLTRHLLRPVLHQIQANLNCAPPSSQRLLWSQETEVVSAHLPRSRIVQNIRTHYVLANSKHFIKQVMMDDQAHAFLNYSSAVVSFSASEASMASIQNLDASFEAAVRNQTYSKRTVQFNDLTGTVFLKANAYAYSNKILQIQSGFSIFGKTDSSNQPSWPIEGGVTALPAVLSDQLKVEVVWNVDVSPKYKSLYIGSKAEPFKLQILHGSGHFAIRINNTDLAEILHKDREVMVHPRGLGPLEVTIEDLELPESSYAIATILISEIDRLSLHSPQSLIEQGDSITITVSAFDSLGAEFDQDQYMFMIFGIETETTGLSRQGGLKTEQTTVNTQFAVFGKEPGIYQQTAFSKSYIGNKNIVSDMIRIEVFPLLEIFPAELLITPLMKYTLQIVGGPQHTQAYQDGSSVEIKFEIDDSNIAIVDQFREVTGLRVGNANLKYQIIQLRSHKGRQDTEVSNAVVSKKSVAIRVRLVTDIEIPLTHQRQIYTKSLVKLNAVLKFGKEYFNHGIAPISYSWNCSQSKVLGLEMPQIQDKATSLVMQSRQIRNSISGYDENFSTTFNSSSLYAQAYKEGESLVSVQIALEYPAVYSKEINWFQTNALVKVKGQLKIQVHDDATHMFLLPPNSLGYIKANTDTRLKLGYSIISVYDSSSDTYRTEQAQNPIVQLVNDKAIKTFDKYGKVTVVVEEGQSFSDQVAMLNVFITDIYSIQMTNGYDAMNLPLGSTLTLPIQFQNEHATKFADQIEGIRVGVILSHPRVVSVSLDKFNSTMTLTSQGSGDCNIVIYLEDSPHIFDTIRVRVSSVVRPLSPVYLHVGGTVEFKILNEDDNKDSVAPNNIWKSSDSNILQIDTNSGKAKGLSEGRAEVMLSNHVNAASIVNIGRIQYGQIDYKNSLVINTDEAIRSEGDLRVRVKLYLSKNGDEVMPTVQFNGITLIKQNVGIMCESEKPEFLLATSEVSEVEGYFCVLRYQQQSSLKQMPRYVRVNVLAYSLVDARALPIYSANVTHFEVQLLSSIKVERQFAEGVSLTRSKRQEQIHVFSSSDFQVQIDYSDSSISSDEPLLKYRVTREDANSNDYNLTIIVPQTVESSFTAKIVLSHPFTKVRRVLPVKFNFELEQPVARAKPQVVQKSNLEYEGTLQKQGTRDSWSSYLMFFFLVLLVLVFIWYQWWSMSLFDLNRNQGAQARRVQAPYSQQNQIREPREKSRQNLFSRDTSIINQSGFKSVNSSAQPRRGLDLDRFNYKRNEDSQRKSIYTNALDGSGAGYF